MSAKIGSRYRAGGSLVLLVVALCVLVAQSLMFLYEGNLVLRDEAQQERLGAALLQMRLVWLDLQDAETGQRGFLLTGDEAYLEPYRRGTSAIDDHLRQAYESLIASGWSVERFAAVRPVIRKKLDELGETVRLRRAGKTEAAIARLREGDGKHYMDQARQIISGEMDSVRADRTGLNGSIAGRVRAVEYILISIGFMIVLTVGIAAGQMLRAIRKSDELAQRLREESTHDLLTGLPNRRMLDQWLEKSLEQAARRTSRVAFFFIDLDGFKRVNDELGHEVGDRVLCEASKRFSAVVRSADLLARFGGDEFGVVVPDVGADTHLAALADRLLHAMEAPLLPDYPEYVIGASIGIAVYPEHGVTIGGLIRAADEAMYGAKRSGKGRFCLASAPAT